MMNQYPFWKYLLVAVAVVLGALYASPNLFGEDPAVQVSATRSTDFDAGVKEKISTALKTAGVEAIADDGQDAQMLLRFADTDAQLRASEAIREVVPDDYVVALNLAPATPDWLRGIGGKPMNLGLDLRGGVHFLLEVDMPAAETKALDSYADELRSKLREEKIRYVGVQQDDGVASFKFRSGEARDQAHDQARENFRDLDFVPVEVDGDFFLNMSLGEISLRETRKFALEQNITTLRNRVNELGVAEPVVQQQGDNRIVVQLPGVQDTTRAKEILGATATLEYRAVDTEGSVEDAQAGRVPPGSKLYKERGSNFPVLLKKRVIVTGDQIVDADSGLDENGRPMVVVNLDGKGGNRMSDFTRQNVGKPMAVVFIENKTQTKLVDGKIVKTKRVVEEVISVATVREHFSSRFQTTGLDSTTEARNLALLLRAGALAAPVEILEERTVGPSLGKDNIDQGFNSVMIGFALVLIFMAIYYKAFGLIANVALTANLILLVSVMSLLGATLTLPGIAGIVLTVGMAVDANVLIFERIREEIANGSSPQASIHSGYEKALSTIADANVTTFIAAIVLFSFGTGPVKGFAVTLSIGILTSMFTAIMGSRAIVNLVYGGRRLKSLSI